MPPKAPFAARAGEPYEVPAWLWESLEAETRITLDPLMRERITEALRLVVSMARHWRDAPTAKKVRVQLARVYKALNKLDEHAALALKLELRGASLDVEVLSSAVSLAMAKLPKAGVREPSIIDPLVHALAPLFEEITGKPPGKRPDSLFARFVAECCRSLPEDVRPKAHNVPSTASDAMRRARCGKPAAK